MKKLVLLFKALVNKIPVVEIEVNDTLSTNIEAFMVACKEKIKIIEIKIAEHATNGETYISHCDFSITVDQKKIICEYFEKAGYIVDTSYGCINITIPVPVPSTSNMQ